MKCDCGYTAFYYQKFADNKKWDVYKCGHVMIESKKKTKCDMNICEYNSEINCPETKKHIVHIQKEKNDVEKLYRDDLQKYIHLCEITQKFLKKYRWNYVANINFLLRKLNFDLYFEDKETLESLKHRIKNKYVPRVIKKTEFPIKLVDYPDYLAVLKKGPIIIEKKKKKSEKIKKKHILLAGGDQEELEENKNENKPREEILPSDAESDSEDVGDNTFDIDNYDSGEDYEDFDDDGAFSD
tara:strand:+ start:15464 stop:16186 length:723 start_codon:yes stop_codon:yes gene_type:complete